MALNNRSIWGSAKAQQLGLETFKPGSSKLNVNFKRENEKCCKRECRCLRVSGPRAMASVEDNEKPIINGARSFRDAEVRDKLTAIEEYLYSVGPKPKPVIDKCFSPKVRVAYKGIAGSYGEDAVLKAYPDCERVPCEEFDAVFKAVESWLADKAVVPIESCVGGSIHRNYDLLLRHKLHIIGEVQLVVNHSLLGLADVTKEELEGIMSKPMKHSGLDASNIGADDIDAASKKVAPEGERGTGAIARTRAAEMYGLDVLTEGIKGDDFNVVRFLMLGRDPITPRTNKPYKTSIVFSLEAGSGALFRALGAFSTRDINLSKIESRPLKQHPLTIADHDSIDGSDPYFDYLFYIDFEASMAEPRAQHALEHLQEYTRFVRVLGCYPVPGRDKSTLQWFKP